MIFVLIPMFLESEAQELGRFREMVIDIVRTLTAVAAFLHDTLRLVLKWYVCIAIDTFANL